MDTGRHKVMALIAKWRKRKKIARMQRRPEKTKCPKFRNISS